MTADLTGARCDAVEAMLPSAAALAVAVADHDSTEVAAVLAPMSTEDLHALTIALAANIDLNKPLTTDMPPRTYPNIVQPAISLAAQTFATDVVTIMSSSRRRNVSDARAVAMYVCRLAGLSSTATGIHFSRDHSTVLHAWGRVGESNRLRTIANRVAIQCGWTRDMEAS